MSGSMTCPGGALDASCFGLTGACPDFSACYLRALGLSLNSSNPLVIPLLQVGMGNDAGVAIVNMGAYPSNPISTFTVYANQSCSIRSLQTTLDLTAIFANAFLQSIGGTTVRTFVESTGQVGITGEVGVSISAPVGNVMISAGSTNMILNQALDTLTISTSNTTHTTGDWRLFRSAGVPWMETRSWESLTCGTAGPLVPSASTSIRFAHDQVQVSGTTLVTDHPSGLLSMAGINLCGDLLKTAGPTLRLQSGTAIKTLDIQAVITNSDPGYAVTIINGEGVNFQDTAIHNELGVPGPLVCDDVEGLSLIANSTLFVNTIRPVNATANGTVYIIGDLNVTGTIYGAVAVDSPSCCTSDLRAKTNISRVDTRTDLETILSVPDRVSFQYTPAYQASDKSVDGGEYSGFIAQELEEVIPRAVRQTKHMLDGEMVEDFRRVTLDRMVPYLVGAVKELYKQNMELREELTKLAKLAKLPFRQFRSRKKMK